MLHIRGFLAVAAAAIGAAVLPAPTPARAGFGVEVYDDGVLQSGITANVLHAPGGGYVLDFTGNTANFSITAGTGTSNAGARAGSKSLISNETIATNFGAAGGTHTLQIVLSQTGLISPTGAPLSLTSSGGGAANDLGQLDRGGRLVQDKESVTATYQGFLDTTDTLFGQPTGSSTLLQSASATLSAVRTAPLNLSRADAVSGAVARGKSFSMTEVLSLTFALDKNGAQGAATISASTTASAIAPAPPGVVLALAAAPLLGLRAWMRRRHLAV